MWCVIVLALSLQPKGLYDAIEVLLRLLKREFELEVVRKYISREA
jgi:hypothetical protein